MVVEHAVPREVTRPDVFLEKSGALLCDADAVVKNEHCLPARLRMVEVRCNVAHDLACRAPFADISDVRPAAVCGRTMERPGCLFSVLDFLGAAATDDERRVDACVPQRPENFSPSFLRDDAFGCVAK